MALIMYMVSGWSRSFASWTRCLGGRQLKLVVWDACYTSRHSSLGGWQQSQIVNHSPGALVQAQPFTRKCSWCGVWVSAFCLSDARCIQIQTRFGNVQGKGWEVFVRRLACVIWRSRGITTEWMSRMELRDSRNLQSCITIAMHWAMRASCGLFIPRDIRKQLFFCFLNTIARMLCTSTVFSLTRNHHNVHLIGTAVPGTQLLKARGPSVPHLLETRHSQLVFLLAVLLQGELGT